MEKLEIVALVALALCLVIVVIAGWNIAKWFVKKKDYEYRK